MQHIHLEQTSSTQEYLKTKFTDLKSPILISCEHQSSGVGRQGSSWHHFQNALAFSFTLSPNPVLTISPLEVACLLYQYFKEDLRIKWPNDLLNKNDEKIGGILCQLLGKQIIVGIGLNLFIESRHGNDFDYPVGPLWSDNPQLENNFKKNLPLNIYSFILKNRLNSKQVTEIFNEKCAYKNREVKIVDANKETHGIFMGIAENGEALLKTNDGLKKVLTGSLRLI